MVADRVLKDVCINIDQKKLQALRDRETQNRGPRSSHGDTHLNKFELRPEGDGYSEDEDVSSNEDISRHERDYKAPYAELQPRTP